MQRNAPEEQDEKSYPELAVKSGVWLYPHNGKADDVV
jgi:hypothetical protein